jgi:hypothetical protein
MHNLFFSIEINGNFFSIASGMTTPSLRLEFNLEMSTLYQKKKPSKEGWQA